MSKAHKIAAESPTPRGRVRGELAGLIAIIAIALVLRLRDLGEQSFWLDELLTLQNAAGKTFEVDQLPRGGVVTDPEDQTHLAHARPWWSVWGSQMRDVHPPAYFVATRLWMNVAGEGEVAVRFLSVLFSVGAVGLLYWAVRELSGPAAGLAAAGLMAVAGPQIEYAQEARMYAMLLALGLGAAVAVVRIERGGARRGRLIAAGLLCLALPLTHYFSVSVVMALGVYALIRLRGRDRAWTVGVIVGAGVVFTALWGWVPLAHVSEIAARGEFLKEGREGLVVRTLERLAQWPIRQLSNARLPGSVAWIGLLAVYGAAAYLLRRRRELLLWGLWVGATLLLVTAVDLVRATGQLPRPRYTLIAGPGLFALIAGGLSAARGGVASGASAQAAKSRATEARPAGLVAHWVAWVVAVAALAWSIATLPAAYAPKYAWRMVAQGLANEASPGDVLVFIPADGRAWYPGALYFQLTHYYRPAGLRVLLLDQPADARTAADLAAAGRVYLFAAAPVADGELRRIIPGLTDTERLISDEIVTVWRGRVGR